MIRILESVDTNSLEPEIQKVVDEIMVPLADECKVSYVDETLMPDEISIEFVWEREPGDEEYIGTWEVDMHKENITNYSNYLAEISTEIQAAYSFIEDAEDTEEVVD